MNISFIGTGQRTWGYIKNICKNHLNVNISKIYDIDHSRAISMKNKAEINFDIQIQAVDNLIDLLNDKNTHIIALCTPDNTHFTLTQTLLKHNKHIILEKPICITQQELKLLTNIKRKTKLFIPFVLRFLPLYIKVKELLPLIGNITLFDMKLLLNYSHSASYYRRWHKSTSNCGSFLLTKCCHDIDILLWLNGYNYKNLQSFGNVKIFTQQSFQNCSKCDIDCKFRFDKGYVFMTEKDIENPQNFDKCIYNNTHNIVDHQSCLFDYNTYNAIFSVCMYNEKSNRTLEIRGENGYILADYSKNIVNIKINNTPPKSYNCDSKIKTGHKGSDILFLQNIISMFQQNNIEDILFTEAIKCTQTCLDLDKSLQINILSNK
jgi:predicted dehydrogenase